MILIFLALLFFLNAFVSFPLGVPHDISREGSDCLRASGRAWYILPAGTYISESSSFGEIYSRSSPIPFVTRRYTRFHVTIRTQDGPMFQMSVRVRDDKRRKLERGESPELYGMVSELSGSALAPQRETLERNETESVCLNDNGATVRTRRLSAAVSLILSALFLFLAWSVKARG